MLTSIFVAIAFALGFAIGHAGPASKLSSIQNEIEKAEGSVSGEGQKLINKIRSIL